MSMMNMMMNESGELTTAQRCHFGLNRAGYKTYLETLSQRRSLIERLMNVGSPVQPQPVQPQPVQPVYKRSSMRSLLVSAVSWLKGLGR